MISQYDYHPQQHFVQISSGGGVAKVEAARFEVVRDEGEMGEKRNWNLGES